MLQFAEIQAIIGNLFAQPGQRQKTRASIPCVFIERALLATQPEIFNGENLFSWHFPLLLSLCVAHVNELCHFSLVTSHVRKDCH
jgi:hypothetical protein